MRIGLFGGSFNPIHNAHITIAKKVKENFELDLLIFIPSKQPPHKQLEGTSFKDRYEMVRLAIENLGDGYQVSDYELNSTGISYTYDTLKYFRDIYKNSKIFFIAGSDIFSTIETWGNWEQLFSLTNFIIVNRPTKSFDSLKQDLPDKLNQCIKNDIYTDDLYGNIILYAIDDIDLSSTAVRHDISIFNETIKYDVPKSVHDYIIENKLYLGELMNSTQMAHKVKQIIDSTNAEDTVVLNIAKVSSITDYMIITSTRSSVMAQAVSDTIIGTIKKEFSISPSSVDGFSQSIWICIDYGDVIVHVMREDERKIYDLEAIWGSKYIADI